MPVKRTPSNPFGIDYSIPPARKFKRKGKRKSSLRTEVKNLKKFVMKTIENKQQNYSTSGSVLDIGYASRPSLAITQGAQDGDERAAAPNNEARIGNSVTLMRTQLKIQLRKATSGYTESRVRLMVVESVDGNQQLDFEDLLQVGQHAGTLVGTDDETYTSNYTTKTDTNKRYKIHFDKVVTLNFYKSNYYYKSLLLKYGKTGKVIEYDGNDPVPTNHNLQILAISDQTAINTAPTISYSLRHSYKDA